MKEYLKIAWRNLWRNKRRTILTILSVFFAVFLALIMRSMQLGSYDMMVRSAVENSTGYIQIHAKGYWDDKSIDNTFVATDSLHQTVASSQYVTTTIPRIESFALASSGTQTKGIALIGTDMVKEDAVSGLSKKIIRGHYLDTNEEGVMVAEKLADYLKLDLNDSVVLISQGYHGITASGLYRIVGIIQFATPAMNNSMIYMGLPAIQYFYAAPDRLTSLSIMLDDKDHLQQTVNELEKLDAENLEVMTWKEMLPELVQGIQGDNISGIVMLGILYLVIGFGILGTILMMTMERKREFGIMVAVGMRRTKLAIIILIETITIGILGIISGMAASFPIILYLMLNPIRLTGEAAEAMLEYNIEPIMPFIIEPGFYINQSLTVIIITLLAGLYPIMVIGKFKVIQALQGK
ncbi:MAG: ABC transporter permease, partial [Bacteroidales bacterium]|nr:ABC transporter permease [Bacteroidales bacterium]